MRIERSLVERELRDTRGIRHTRVMSAFDRRSVLIGGAGLLGGALVADACTPKTPEHSEEPPKHDEHPHDASGGEMTVAEVMPILAAVCQRLVPSDESGPGVKECGIESYLEKALADPRMHAIKSIATRGAVFVGRAARKEHEKSYWELQPIEQDDLIRRLANNEVRPNNFQPQAFVRVMLALSLECFLGDPRHGGNKDQVGWKYVGGIDWAGRHA
jgi:gluconate 2-dehydrogenase gamma chain